MILFLPFIAVFFLPQSYSASRSRSAIVGGPLRGRHYQCIGQSRLEVLEHGGVAAWHRDSKRLAGSRLELVEADALKIDLATLGPPPRRIVANLPYNVSTALLVGWLHQADHVCDMVLMFQKEVADRLAAQPRSKDYGRLSVLAQHVCTVQRLFDVAPSAFVPPPKVVSSVVRLRPRSEGRLADLRPLERVTAAAFGQRRKMLRSSLAGAFASPVAVLERLGLAPTARAEELSVPDFVRLAEALDK